MQEDNISLKTKGILHISFFVALLFISNTALSGAERRCLSLSPAYEFYNILGDHVEHCYALDIGGRINSHFIGGYVAIGDLDLNTLGAKYRYYFFKSPYIEPFVAASAGFLYYHPGALERNTSYNFILSPEVGVEGGFEKIHLYASYSHLFIMRPAFRLRFGVSFNLG